MPKPAGRLASLRLDVGRGRGRVERRIVKYTIVNDTITNQILPARDLPAGGAHRRSEERLACCATRRSRAWQPQRLAWFRRRWRSPVAAVEAAAETPAGASASGRDQGGGISRWRLSGAGFSRGRTKVAVSPVASKAAVFNVVASGRGISRGCRSAAGIGCGRAGSGAGYCDIQDQYLRRLTAPTMTMRDSYGRSRPVPTAHVGTGSPSDMRLPASTSPQRGEVSARHPQRSSIPVRLDLQQRERAEDAGALVVAAVCR